MSKSKTLCVLPWMHLATHPSGGTSLCCRSNHKDAVSWAMQPGTTLMMTLEDFKLQDQVNCETFVRVRQAMLDGERPVECEGCWRDEDAGIYSKREYENARWAHIIPELEQTAVLSKADYRYVELRLGNVCNNACVTCNSYSSSKWYADEVKISKDLPWFELRPEQNFKWHDRPDFYKELADFSPNVEEIYINGGEPTLIKAHFRYLESLIQSGQASKVHLVYSLNMMNIPDQLTTLWKQFKRVTVNCSIDDVNKRNFYIRWPSEWKDTVESILKLNSIPTVEWKVIQTVSIFNVFTLDKLDNWLYSNFGKYPAFNFVLYPEHLSFSVIPDDVKQELKAYYVDKLNQYQRAELFAKLDSAIYNEELNKRATEYVIALDRSRGLSFLDYVPNLGKIINVNT